MATFLVSSSSTKSGRIRKKTIDNTNFVTTRNFEAGGKIVGSGGEKDDVLEVKSDTPVLTAVAFSGGAGQDLLVGGSGDDLLNGDGGLDRLQGGLGNDSLLGGTEDDWLMGEGGADLLDGGDGFDIANYSTAKAGIEINLATGMNGGDAVGDTLRSIEQITGSAYADVITGDAANNVIEGAGGNDTISGGDGDDILSPGWGDDVVDGGNGTDTLVIDYSTLPTQAVAWRGNNQNDQGHNYVYVRNAYGIGDAIRTELDAQGTQFSLSGDGTTIAISGKVKDQNGIWVKNFTDDTNTTKIDDIRGDSVSLSKDGSKITWTRNDDNKVNPRTSSEIFVANTDGSQVKRLTNDNINDTLATISDDGSTIAWAKAITPDVYSDGSSTGTYRTEVFVSNSDGSNIRRITNNNWNDPQRSLSLSADGSKVTWQADGAYGPLGLLDTLVGGFWVANTDGTNVRQLYKTRISNQNPSISDDGSKVAWNDTPSTGEASKSYTYIIDTDSSQLKIVPNTIGAGAFSTQSLSGDGQKIVFSRNSTTNGTSLGLYVASVDGTEPLTLIDNSPGWNYGYSNANGAAISDYVDKGVIYKSFDSNTGSGEIFTWGPSRIRYSNIERFDIIGTRYGDELRGGDLDDKLTGGGGADTLKGALGNDTYSFNVESAAGSQIEDTGGEDVLELKTITTDAQGIQNSTNIAISLSDPNAGILGMKRDGANLIIDINQDGAASAKSDLSVINFFNATGTAAGNGFIEKILDLSGNDILTKFKAIDVTNPPSQLVISNNQIAEDTLVNTIIGNLNATSSNGDILTYSLITGTGDTDNSLFEIVDNTVRVKISPDFEIKNNYTVRIKATNQKGLSTEKPFTINITNINEAPSQITIDNLQIPENSPINTVVGNLSAIDPDTGDTITYSILPTDDHQAFLIVGNQLQLATIPDFETKSSYQLQLQATDQAGLNINKSFTISVTDLPESPTPPVTPPVVPPVTPIPGVTLDKNLFNFISSAKGFGVKAQNQKPGSKVNEIVMLALDNAAGSINGLTLTSPGYFAAALDRAKTIFSTLGGDFFDTSVREISIDPTKFYQFIEIQDASLSDVKQQISQGIIPTNILYSLDGLSSPIKVSENSTKNGYQVSINNDELVLDILPLSGSAPSQPLGSNIQNTKAAENRLIDLTAYAGQTLKVDLNTKSSAAYNNNIGFYAVEDATGTIKLADGTLLTTDKANYAIEAVKQAVLTATKTDSKLDQNLAGGKIYAPVLVSQGTLDSFIANNPTNSGGGNAIHAYFNYVGANPDKVDHFRLIGNNTFGVEDLYGGGDRDFNDLVINLNIKAT